VGQKDPTIFSPKDARTQRVLQKKFGMFRGAIKSATELDVGGVFVTSKETKSCHEKRERSS